jgi:hypothetical protein
MSQISAELKNAIITIGTHRVIWRIREEERRQQELLREETVLENLGDQSSASNEITIPTPTYPSHHFENLLAYDRNVATPTPATIIARDMTIEDNREENDQTPTRENPEPTSATAFLESFRQALSRTVREGEISQARRRSRESYEEPSFPTTSSIIVIPEETPEEAAMRTSQESSARATYLKNIQATIGRMEASRSSQSVVTTNITNDCDISERQETKRRRLQ